MTKADRSADDRTARIRSSMLWGAWADALGFISEMTTASNLKRRTRGRPLDEPFDWSRQVGGRSGVRVDLPAGTYSDDTQLRLCTSRAISSNGFDVEAFAKVELSVWPSYALGGGRASRAAAASIGKQQSTWATNFFDGWHNSGGNGAAMRIQPHVYASAEYSTGEYLDDVIRNAVVTHGHPRGIAGAVLHAASLAFTLEQHRVPESNDWSQLLATVASSITAFERVPELETYWLPQWEAITRTEFRSVWYATVQELDDMLSAVEPSLKLLRTNSDDKEKVIYAYSGLIDSLNLTTPENRGSATATTVAALALAGALPSHPSHAAQVAAAILNTDTDTIASMACSLVGAAAPCLLTSPVQDEHYLSAEADRLSQISHGRKVAGFPYPDLLKWKAPKSAIDCVGTVDGELEMAGLGRITSRTDGKSELHASGDAVWRWVETSFGSTMLIKSRVNPHELPPGNVSRPRTTSPADEVPPVDSAPDQLTFDSPRSPSGSRPLDLGEVTRWVEQNNFSDRALGYALRRIAQNGSNPQMREFIDYVQTKVRTKRGA